MNVTYSAAHASLELWQSTECRDGGCEHHTWLTSLRRHSNRERHDVGRDYNLVLKISCKGHQDETNIKENPEGKVTS